MSLPKKQRVLNRKTIFKMKKAIIIAALLLAAIAPLRAQEWVRENDTTWVRRYERSTGSVTEYAYQVDQMRHIAKLNNDLRSAALLQVGAWGTGAATMLVGMAYAKKPTNNLKAATIALGVVTLGLEVWSVCKIHQRKVFFSPEGVMIRIGRVEEVKSKKGVLK